jgi:hypothetical protein
LAFLLNGIIAIVTALIFMEQERYGNRPPAFPASRRTCFIADYILSMGAVFNARKAARPAPIIAAALYVAGLRHSIVFLSRTVLLYSH